MALIAGLLIVFVLFYIIFCIIGYFVYLVQRSRLKLKVDQMARAYRKQEFRKQKQKQKKEDQVPVNPELVAALMKLGFKKKESTEAIRKAMKKVSSKNEEALLKEALNEL